MRFSRGKQLAVIEAGNIRGLGSVAVCKELIPALLKKLVEQKYLVRLIASDKLLASLKIPLALSSSVLLVEQKHNFFHVVMRILRYFYRASVNNGDKLLVLGDLPFSIKSDQAVFLQQPNIISSSVDKLVGQSFKFKVMRYIFARNIRHASRVIVQTEAMKKNAMLSYNLPAEIISVARHQLPKIEIEKPTASNLSNRGCPWVFFYPASNYLHKNHALLWAAIHLIDSLKLDVRFDLTINADQAPEAVRGSRYIRYLGPLTASDCYRHYVNCDALFFPSKLESYGLPLLEALRIFNIPVLAADRPYAREVCGELAVYFDPDRPEDFVEKLNTMLGVGLTPVTSESVGRLPALVTWDEMAAQLLGCKA